MADKISIKRMDRQKKGHPPSFPCPCTSCKCLNSKAAVFCTQCGEPLVIFEEITEYKCGECEFIVEKNDKFCWQCGQDLNDRGEVIYVEEGTRLTETEFKKVKKEKNGKKAGSLIRKIVIKDV